MNMFVEAEGGPDWQAENLRARSNVISRLHDRRLISRFERRFVASYNPQNLEIQFAPRFARHILYPNKYMKEGLPVIVTGGRDIATSELEDAITDPQAPHSEEDLKKYYAEVNKIGDTITGLLVNGGVVFSYTNPTFPPDPAAWAQVDRLLHPYNIHQVFPMDDKYRLGIITNDLEKKFKSRGVSQINDLEEVSTTFLKAGIPVDDIGTYPFVFSEGVFRSLFSQGNSYCFLDVFPGRGYSSYNGLSCIEEAIMCRLKYGVFGQNNLPVRMTLESGEQMQAVAVEDYIYKVAAHEMLASLLWDLAHAYPRTGFLSNWKASILRDSRGIGFHTYKNSTAEDILPSKFLRRI